MKNLSVKLAIIIAVILMSGFPMLAQKPLNASSADMLIGDWDLMANGYAGKLEIRANGSALKGRVYYKVYNKWEPLENLQFDPSTRQFTFYRPNAKQKHEGVLSGNTLNGTFNGKSKWSAIKISQSVEINQPSQPQKNNEPVNVNTSSVEMLLGDWDLMANGFAGILEIRANGSALKGRVYYKVYNKWEPLEDLRFDPSTSQFTFYRPNAKQKHEGILNGTTLKGTFNGNSKWSAIKTVAAFR